MIREILARILPGSPAHKEAKRLLDKQPPKGEPSLSQASEIDKEGDRYDGEIFGRKMRQEAARRLARGDFDVHP